VVLPDLVNPKERTYLAIALIFSGFVYLLLLVLIIGMFYLLMAAAALAVLQGIAAEQISTHPCLPKRLASVRYLLAHRSAAASHAVVQARTG
jgi:hypothetical protein